MYMYMYTVHVYYTCVHLRLVKVFVTREQDMMWRSNLHGLTSPYKSQKALEACGCKPNLACIHSLPPIHVNVHVQYKCTKY